MTALPAVAATPEELFAAIRAADSARPIVTFYDRSTGERAELSAASLGNWIAKTHFLLTDELGSGVGDAAYVDLPVHWLTLAVWFGAFSAGLSLTSDPSSASVAFTDVDALDGAAGCAEVFAVPLLPWGRGFDNAPDGTTDYVTAVRPQADAWGSVRRAGTPADAGFNGVTRSELISAARARAGEVGLPEGARVLLTDRAARALSLIDVLATLTVGGSLVLVRHAGASSIDTTLIAQEQITAVL